MIFLIACICFGVFSGCAQSSGICQLETLFILTIQLHPVQYQTEREREREREREIVMVYQAIKVVSDVTVVKMVYAVIALG